MSFSIGYGVSNLGAVVIVLAISVAGIALAFLLAASRQARRRVLEEDAEPPAPER